MQAVSFHWSVNTHLLVKAGSKTSRKGFFSALARCSTNLASVTKYIQYEVWCPLPATHLVDISAVADTKWAAISQHQTALKCGDYLTASQGLARYRGLLLGKPGTDAAAEAFVAETADEFRLQRQHWLASTARHMLS